MKTAKYIILSACAILAASCAKDPWAGVEKGDWNHEKSIVDIKFQGQAGLPVIENTDEASGTIELQLATDNIADMSKVKVEYITLSYGATGSVKSGDTIDFTATAAPTITVISPNGDIREYTISMKEFRETLTGCYKIQKSMLWGGTGPEWGGGALLDPSSKSWCWNQSGFGPTAEYDNYLEFTLDRITDNGNTEGTCINWAGVDGKYWNCIYLAAHNLEGKTDIDLHKFYRMIPMGTSKWTRDYTANTITFTSDKGVVTTCELLPADTYPIYRNDETPGYNKDLEVTDFAFKFALNGVDDWVNNYKDYDKFVKRPRTYFIHFESVDTIPEEAKTEGTEGDITIAPPVEPEPEPEKPGETPSIAGKYKVASMTVFTGADPSSLTTMTPDSKSWVWESPDVYQEKDNILILTPSGTDAAGNEIGEADYQAGANGKFWGYMMKAGSNKFGGVVLDCSAVYDAIPHGKSKYTYDAKNETVTFKVGSSATVSVLLKAGEYYDRYEYQGKKIKDPTKQYVVSEGNIAFEFEVALDMANAPTSSSYAYDDFVWVYWGVHNYMLQFSKVTE